MSILFDDTEQFDQHGSYKQKWYGKNEPNSQATANKYDELLVFGYHCKLFRDDEQAEMVNEGKTLIPWMGNNDLMIDRYDCRGHLYRLEDFDFNGQVFQDWSAEELEEERACDKERYRELEADMIEEDILEEEEEKRSKALYDPYTAYQSYGYTYDDDNTDGKALSDYTFNEESFKQYCQYYGLNPNDPNVKAYFQGQSYQYDYERPPPPPEPPTNTIQPELFEPPEGIEIPSNMTVPETKKMQAIIEKTAMFISKNSAQMEIVLKAKQAGNPQFNFLNFGDYMNPYYKFILEKIKEGLYVPPVEKKVDEKEEESKEKNEEGSSDDDSSGDEGELHPLLQAHRRPITKPQSPKLLEAEKKPIHQAEEAPKRPVGKIEDLTKIYMTMKYKPSSEHDQPLENTNERTTNEYPPPNTEVYEDPNSYANYHDQMMHQQSGIHQGFPHQQQQQQQSLNNNRFPMHIPNQPPPPPQQHFANNNFYTQQSFPPPPPPMLPPRPPRTPIKNIPLMPPGEDFVSSSPPAPQFVDVTQQIPPQYSENNDHQGPVLPMPHHLPQPPQPPWLRNTQQHSEIASNTVSNSTMVPVVSENDGIAEKDNASNVTPGTSRLPSPPPLPLPPPLPTAPNLLTAAIGLNKQPEVLEDKNETSSPEDRISSETPENDNQKTTSSRYKPSAMLSQILESSAVKDTSKTDNKQKEKRKPLVSRLVPYAEENEKTDEPVDDDRDDNNYDDGYDNDDDDNDVYDNAYDGKYREDIYDAQNDVEEIDEIKPKSILKQGNKINFRVEEPNLEVDYDTYNFRNQGSPSSRFENYSDGYNRHSISTIDRSRQDFYENEDSPIHSRSHRLRNREEHIERETCDRSENDFINRSNLVQENYFQKSPTQAFSNERDSYSSRYETDQLQSVSEDIYQRPQSPPESNISFQHRPLHPESNISFQPRPLHPESNISPYKHLPLHPESDISYQPSQSQEESNVTYDFERLHPESAVHAHQHAPSHVVGGASQQVAYTNENMDNLSSSNPNASSYQQYYQQLVNSETMIQQTYSSPAEDTTQTEISRPPQMYSNQSSDSEQDQGKPKPYIEGNVSPPPPPPPPTRRKAKAVVEPPVELKSVIERLATYVAKNGVEFESGIKEKNDPRFDFLNNWNTYHPYYLKQKKLAIEQQKKLNQEEDDRRKNLKVSFGLKTKSQPIGKGMTITTKQKLLTKPPSSVFNHDDDEHEEPVEETGKIQEDKKVKLQKQIEEKERLLKQLHEQAILQQNINEANRQASQKHSALPLTPQQQASLKRKLQTEKLIGEGFSSKPNSEKSSDQLKKASSSWSDEKTSSPTSSSFLRKRETRSRDKDLKHLQSSSKIAKKQDAFFEAINQAFNG